MPLNHKLHSVLALLVALMATPCFGQIVINEFMATNSSAVNDPNFDESADWVELYNTTAAPVLLNGYYLTDNLSDTLKWALPSGTTIPGFGFLLIWADGMDTGLHTNFRLSSLGEEIGLYDNSLTLSDGFVYTAPPLGRQIIVQLPIKALHFMNRCSPKKVGFLKGNKPSA
jgi:hypothetical protein